jgi:hypothetical protein
MALKAMILKVVREALGSEISPITPKTNQKCGVKKISSH